MKYIMFLLCLLLVAILFILGCHRREYPAGRDTYRSFGNGRYQLLRGSEKRLDLFDVETGVQILGRVRDYESRQNLIYLVGVMNDVTTYVVVDIDNAEVLEADSIDVFPDHLSERLRKLAIE